MNKDFKEALSNFSFDAAAGKAIRHLCDLGRTAEQIQRELDYPVPVSRIEKEMQKYQQEKQAAASGEGYRIVKEYGKYGKTYFRKIKDDACSDE